MSDEQPPDAAASAAQNSLPPESDGDNDHALTESSGDDADRPRKKQKRPMSVSCELCKQRKVKCDRGQPSCGWCSRNEAVCEYKERKKPGLRAGYGRELEQRLDKLEEILQAHSRILESLTVRQIPSMHTVDAKPQAALEPKTTYRSAPPPPPPKPAELPPPAPREISQRAQSLPINGILNRPEPEELTFRERPPGSPDGPTRDTEAAETLASVHVHGWTGGEGPVYQVVNRKGGVR